MPFDPQAPYVGEDGFEYEDFGHFLISEPAGTTRNGNIRSYRNIYGDTFARDYARIFDRVAGRQLIGPSPKFAEAHDVAINWCFAEHRAVNPARRP